MVFDKFLIECFMFHSRRRPATRISATSQKILCVKNFRVNFLFRKAENIVEIFSHIFHSGIWNVRNFKYAKNVWNFMLKALLILITQHFEFHTTSLKFRLSATTFRRDILYQVTSTDDQFKRQN